MIMTSIHGTPAHRSPARSTRALAWLLALDLLAAAPGLASPTFEFLGDLPGGSTFAEAFGVSADGTFVVGNSSSASSGIMNPNVGGQPTEGFVWDGNTGTMVGVGDLPGGRFNSRATDVSADGRFVVGTSEIAPGGTFLDARFVPYRWNRVGDPFNTAGIVALSTPEHLFRFIPSRTRSSGHFAAATAISDDGAVIVGFSQWTNLDEFAFPILGFYWSRNLGLTFLSVPPTESDATAISPDGTQAVGNFGPNGSPTNAFRQAFVGGIASGSFQDLGQIGNVVTRPTAVSIDGLKIAGDYFPPGSPRGIFQYDESAPSPYSELRVDGTRAVGMSGDGRVILDNVGGLYLDGRGPFDLREILADAGATDLRSLPSSLFRPNAISTSGLVIVGGAFVSGLTQAWRAQLTDCDENGLPDELEFLAYGPERVAGMIAQGSERFSASRDTLGHGDMISQYGAPWKPDTNRVPERDETQPAEFLRAVQSASGCGGTELVRTEESAERFLVGLALPSALELQSFELLLGNEALADALDPTIGLDNIQPDDLSDQFAFKGIAGITDLLAEELALLRGRQLPGSPADWLDETVYYPEFTGGSPPSVRAAVYNRLPPNAVGANGLAYRSNYRVTNNGDAATRFPQGHGDAHGHYLSAMKHGLELLRDGPQGLAEEFRGIPIELLAEVDESLEIVRRLAQAGAALAQCAASITELLYRRDYRENSEDERVVEVFSDPDPERAWAMGDWARRGAVGALFDWALVAHLAPTDEARPVHRGNLAELDEIAAAANALQERLDTAGAGLDPLGLVQNVVPFGIDASGLEPGSGRSHYEQVRDAATRALDNARRSFELANQAGQRLRESDQAFETFANQLEDTRADHNQQLIEIFGLPPSNDPRDNDLDPTTTNSQESQFYPDLANFLATDDVLAAEGLAPRPAPGQVQLALSELKVAGLRVEQAELALDDLAAQIQSQIERIALVEEVQVERVEIITQARDDQIALTDRLEEIKERQKSAGMFGSFTKALVGAATGSPAGIVDFVGQLATEAADALMTGSEGNEFDVERERTRVQAWKEIELTELDGKLTIDAETRQLKALVRQTPQRLIDIAVAQEVAAQALGRLRQSIERGRLILREKRRLEARTQGQLVQERWKDMSFRVFRNAALKNYRAFFDIAARYVVLAARAFAYEFDSRSSGDDALSGIYRERRLGGAAGLGGGLQSVLNRLDAAVTVNNFNRPLESLGERSFSFRRNLLGIGVEDFPNDDLRLRAFLESQIVERVEDLAEVRDVTQLSVQNDFGPAIVLPFSTEIDGRNFFGRGPELPFGNTNFLITRNAKIRSYAIRFDGVESALGIDPESGSVSVHFLPVGDSVLRENTNRPIVEDELISPWAVVDQFLPVPPLASTADLGRRDFNPWRTTAQAGGNFLGSIKRHRGAEAQVELGQALRFNTSLAGRSAWNTRWLLVIPGSQWTSSSDPVQIRRKLQQFIYGAAADPTRHVGINDIRLIIQAYSH